jgi:hypothetical protein
MEPGCFDEAGGDEAITVADVELLDQPAVFRWQWDRDRHTL